MPKRFKEGKDMKFSVFKRDIWRLWRKIIFKPSAWVLFLFSFSFLVISVDRVYSPVNQISYTTVSAQENRIKLAPSLQLLPLLKSKGIPFPEDISAGKIFIRERGGGEIVFAKNEHERSSPASLTKILTALMVVEHCDLTKEVTASSLLNQGSLMGLKDGERVTYEGLLYGMLMVSGNDAAELAARSCLESEAKAVQLINEEIAFLGLPDSHFEDVTGLAENDHYSSAFDLSVMAEVLLRNEKLAAIVNQKEITLHTRDYTRWYSLKNSNELLFTNSKVYGVKTGYTEKAGECLIVVYRQGDLDFLITILGSNYRFQDGEKIIAWLQSNY